MFKVGLFTFGGGYAMIGVIEREIVEKKKWLNQNEFLNVVAIAESTPGPLAINTSTFVGFKREGFWGSVFASIGVILPSFIIILVISLFFDAFLGLKYVGYAFRGIQVAVAYLILSAGLKMFFKIKKTFFNVLLFILSTVSLVLLTFFAVNFSTVFIILIGGTIGLIAYLISTVYYKNKKTVKPDFAERSEEKSSEEGDS